MKVSDLCRFVSSNSAFGEEKVRPEMRSEQFQFLCAQAFKLPSDPSVPISAIGPGATEQYPFRGFIQKALPLAESETLGPAHLFFGCRDE